MLTAQLSHYLTTNHDKSTTLFHLQKLLVIYCYIMHIGIEVGGAVPPKFGKNIFQAISIKFGHFSGKSCKIQEFC